MCRLSWPTEFCRTVVWKWGLNGRGLKAKSLRAGKEQSNCQWVQFDCWVERPSVRGLDRSDMERLKKYRTSAVSVSRTGIWHDGRRKDCSGAEDDGNGSRRLGDTLGMYSQHQKRCCPQSHLHDMYDASCCGITCFKLKVSTLSPMLHLPMWSRCSRCHSHCRTSRLRGRLSSRVMQGPLQRPHSKKTRTQQKRMLADG